MKWMILCFLKNLVFLIKAIISKTIKNEAKEQKRKFARMLLGTLGASLLRILLICKGMIQKYYQNNLNVFLLIQEIIYLRQRMGHM